MNTFSRILFLSLLVGLLPIRSLTYAGESDVLLTTNLKELWLKDDEFAEAAGLEVELQNESFRRGSDIENLLRAKYKIIGGDLRLAKFYLNRIDENKSKLFAIKKRYLAIISFIEGNFGQSIEHLKDKRFYDNSIFPQICLLKLINFMAINDTESLRIDKDSCLNYSIRTSKNEAYWLNTMIKLKLKDKEGVKRNLLTDIEKTLSDDEMSKLWLKTGLYLNKEEDLLKILELLPESSYQSKRIREIVAFMYLRSNKSDDVQKALSFIDDVDSANAENIKGMVNLKNKEYELAFGHFRLALQKKQDSTNSLERAIPLAWILGQWKDGLAMLDNNTNKELNPRNKRAIRVAFLIREKKFIDAQKELELLKMDFQYAPPLEVNIMDSYVTLALGEKDKKFDKRKVEETTEAACRSFDGVSCWIALQFIQWENLGKTIKRDEEIFADKEMTLDSLKEKKTISQLKELITVDQRDIEELDSSSIQLLKNNK